MKKIILITAVFLALVSCEKQTDWKLQSTRNSLLIVDGMITNEMKAHSIKLSFPVSQLNATPGVASGANVNISDGDSTHHLTEQPQGSGIYYTSSDFVGHVGRYYTLLINYKNNIYTAKTTMMPGYFFPLLQYAQNKNNNLYHITSVANAYNAQRYAMYEILLDWSNVAGYQTSNPDSCKARLLYYTLPTVDVSEVFSPEIEKISFPFGTKITERRYSMTLEYAQFIRALLSETNWQGGLFDSAHSNLPTNISTGGAGFFAACAVTSIKDSVH